MDSGWDTVHHREVRGTPSEFVVVYCLLLFVCCVVCNYFFVIFSTGCFICENLHVVCFYCRKVVLVGSRDARPLSLEILVCLI